MRPGRSVILGRLGCGWRLYYEVDSGHAADTHWLIDHCYVEKGTDRQRVCGDTVFEMLETGELRAEGQIPEAHCFVVGPKRVEFTAVSRT